MTYELGDTDVNYPTPFSNSTGESNGLGLGLRLGFHLNEIFFLALDGRYATPQFKDSSVTYDEKANSSNWGPVVGLQMPTAGLRLWGSLIAGGTLDPASTGNFDVKFDEASGYRLGVGLHLFSLSLNLEYQDLKYGQARLQKLGPFSTTSDLDNVDLESKSWIASVSFPLEF